MEIDHTDHRQLGIDLFNLVWEYLEKPERTEIDNETMLHALHASRYHWGVAGTAVNWARGVWQISRVCSTLNRYEPARFHAQKCLDLCLANNIVDFDLAYAYEALARAAGIGGNASDRQYYYGLAEQAGRAIAEVEDRQLFFQDLLTIPSNH